MASTAVLSRLKFNNTLIASLLPIIHHALKFPLAIKGFKMALIFAALRYINSTLSQWSLNNWQSVPPFKSEDEVVLITGGSSGIGKLVVQDLARRAKGIKIFILDIQEPGYDLPPNTYFYKTDITSRETLRETATKLRKEYSHPTILINNAGVSFMATILDKPEEHILTTFAVNNIAHYWIVKEFLPEMITKNHGHIVSVSSLAGFVAAGEMADYAGTKASAVAFHESLRQELKFWYKAPKVRTSVIHPIWARTPMTEVVTETGTPFRQLVIDAREISKAIVNQILSQNSGQVVVPSQVSFLSMLRAFPHWVQEMVRDGVSRDIKEVMDIREKNKY